MFRAWGTQCLVWFNPIKSGKAKLEERGERAVYVGCEADGTYLVRLTNGKSLQDCGKEAMQNVNAGKA